MTTLKKKLEGAAAPLPSTAPLATPEDRVAAAVRRSRLYLPFGRGSRGKSMWSRYFLGAKIAAGKKILAADIDRVNHTLSDRMPEILKPQDKSDASVMEIVRYVVETMADTGVDGLIDSGANDHVLLPTAKKMEFGTWLPSIGIDPVVLFFLGANSEDLKTVSDFSEANFTPAATIMMLNQSAVPPNMSPREAFQQNILKHPVFKEAMKGNSMIGVVPVLEPALDIENAGLSFQDAIANRPSATGAPALGRWCAQQVVRWERELLSSMSKFEEWL